MRLALDHHLLTLDTIGRYVDILDALMRDHAADAAFTDRVHWLPWLVGPSA